MHTRPPHLERGADLPNSHDDADTGMKDMFTRIAELHPRALWQTRMRATHLHGSRWSHQRGGTRAWEEQRRRRQSPLAQLPWPLVLAAQLVRQADGPRQARQLPWPARADSHVLVKVGRQPPSCCRLLQPPQEARLPVWLLLPRQHVKSRAGQWGLVGGCRARLSCVEQRSGPRCVQCWGTRGRLWLAHCFQNCCNVCMSVESSLLVLRKR